MVFNSDQSDYEISSGSQSGLVGEEQDARGIHTLGFFCESPELLSNLVFEDIRLCSDLISFCGFNSVFEFDSGDDFGEVVKAA